MSIQLPYDRKDYYSILSFLKNKAYELSNGRWSDFSDADIGTVILKLMSMLSDMNNYHVDRGINELYIDTATDRASLLSLCKLIGYKPNHYLSAHTTIELVGTSNDNPLNGDIIQPYASFTDANRSVVYTSLSEGVLLNNICRLEVYEGTLVEVVKGPGEINSLGQIYLEDYEVGTNTIQVNIDGRDYGMVDDVRYSDGEQDFSVHMSDEKYIYIQLPPFWADLITESSVIIIHYLKCNGVDGRIGENVLTKIESLRGLGTAGAMINGNEISEGGYNPETIQEIKENAPEYVRTMDTIVTKNDFKELTSKLLGIADVVALDYNDEDSGLVYPDDHHKLICYVLPEVGNSILKEESEYTEEDKRLLLNYGIQPLTELGEIVRDYVDKRRLSGLKIYYQNLDILNPNIVIDIYMDKNHIKYPAMSNLVREFIAETLKRGNTDTGMKIGQNLYASVIGAKIIKNFPEIEYCEVRSPIEKIACNAKQFVNVELANIRVNMNDIK